jgi:hypothetical protein
MEPLKDFLADRCEIGKGKVVPVEELRRRYGTYCRLNSIKWPLSPPKFNAEMKRLGFDQKATRIKGTQKRCWIGLGLKSQRRW